MRFLAIFLALLPNLLFASLDMTKCGDCESSQGRGGQHNPPQQQRSDKSKRDRGNKKEEKLESGKIYRAKAAPHYWKKVCSEDTQEQRQRLNTVKGKQPDLDNMLEIADTALTHAEYANDEIPDDYRTGYDDDGHTDYSRIYNKIARIFIDTFDKGTALVPIVSEGRDIIEAVTGKNAITGEELTAFERGLAIVGAATLGFGDKPLKAIKALSTIAHETSIFTDGYHTVKSTVQPAFSSAYKLLWEKSSDEIAETMRFIRKYKVDFSKETRVDWINSFFKGSKVEVLKADEIGIRYYTKGGNSPRSHFLTDKLTDNPQADLALSRAPQDVIEWIIPKGTEVLKSKAAPKYGQPGGGFQYYVPNPADLIEVIKK
jgi:hypothetical protein